MHNRGCTGQGTGLVVDAGMRVQRYDACTACSVFAAAFIAFRGNFCRAVGQHHGLRPDPRELLQIQGLVFLTLGVLGVCRLVWLGIFSLELSAKLQQLIFADQGLHGIGAHIVPVAVKAARQVFDHRAGCQHIDIHKVAIIRCVEIGVAQIAPAHYAHGVISHKQLVVHALLGALKVRQYAPGPPQAGAARTRQRVEHAHFHIGHKSQAHDLCIRACAVKVVQQHPHPHTTLCGFHNGAQ